MGDAIKATDSYGRRFHYLRLSVTEVCNFRCTYCLPNGWKKSSPMNYMDTQEIRRLVFGFASMGLAKVRLTGGEPAVRKDLTSIIEAVSDIDGVNKVAMTTNGYNLNRYVDDWVSAGLSHLNISIDALNRETFLKITGHDRFEDVMAGLGRALEHDLGAVKVNAVLLRDSVEDGFKGWSDFVRNRPVTVRFIELMRTLDNAEFFADQHVSGEVLRGWLTQNGWAPKMRGIDDGPAIEFVHPDYVGRIGLIAPYSKGFCDSCNRLRVSAKGNMKLCLFGNGGLDLRDLLQSDGGLEEFQARVLGSLQSKNAGHRLSASNPGDTMNLAQTGG
ncbi:GTP 3',8-cyclase MoaA [Robiginitomaculum antarcticum]|uniref:GTP 3',8-cyclase MoaA n=1 Tax=Robiginitomaculum antarcticum TaxID=437507 RepID=UPI000477908B